MQFDHIPGVDENICKLATKILTPETYFENHINNKIRLNNRQFHQHRPVIVSTDEIKSQTNVYGSSIVTIGRTVVSAVITIHSMNPTVKQPSYGDIGKFLFDIFIFMFTEPFRFQCSTWVYLFIKI